MTTYEKISDNIESEKIKSMEFLKSQVDNKDDKKMSLLDMAIKYGKRRKKLEAKK